MILKQIEVLGDVLDPELAMRLLEAMIAKNITDAERAAYKRGKRAKR